MLMMCDTDYTIHWVPATRGSRYAKTEGEKCNETKNQNCTGRVRWYRHVNRRPTNATMRRMLTSKGVEEDLEMDPFKKRYGVLGVNRTYGPKSSVMMF